MKKIIGAVILCAILCCTLGMLTSCFEDRIDAGKYVGEKTGEIEVLYDQIMFSENDDDVAGTLYIIYDYFIDDDTITLTVDRVDYLGDDEGDYEERMNDYYKGRSYTYSYEELEDGFKMGGEKFTRK